MNTDKKLSIVLKIVGILAIFSIAVSAVYYFVMFLPQEQDQVQYDACMTAYNNEPGGGETGTNNLMEAIGSGNASSVASVESFNDMEYKMASANCEKEFPRANTNVSAN